MTEQDDELKDLFRRKNLENAFPPDEQNWKKMSSVLKNAQEDRRRLLVYFSLLLLLLGLGGTWFFVQQNENSLDTLALKSPQPGKKAGVPVVNLQQPGTAQTKQQREALKHEQMKREIQPSEKAGAPVVSTQQPGPAQAKLKSVHGKQEIFKQRQVKMEIQAVGKNRTSHLEKETAPLISGTSVSGKQVSVEESSHLEPQPEKKELIPPNKDTRETKDKELNEGEEMPIATTQLKAEVSDSDQDHQNLSQRDTVPGLTTNHLTDTILTDDLAKKANKVLEEKRDSAVAAVVPARDSVPSKTTPSQRIFLEAGFNYLLGWKTNNKTEASGFNPLIGLQYYHDVSRRIGLSIGLQYSTINHLSSTSHTSTTTRIKFGEESDVTVISALNMHYLLMPLKLSYGFSSNDFVCVGYTMAYLLDVESKVEKYSTRLDYSSTPVVTRSMGYTSGFNPYDGQITVCYRRRLYKEWYVNGEFFYGLRDIKNNAVYTPNKFERTCGCKLSLSINLWKK